MPKVIAEPNKRPVTRLTPPDLPIDMVISGRVAYFFHGQRGGKQSENVLRRQWHHRDLRQIGTQILHSTQSIDDIFLRRCFMEIMIAHDHFYAGLMGVVHQRANLRFIVKQLDVDNID